MRLTDFQTNLLDPRESIRKIIDDILRAESWNQETLAHKIGVTQPAISRWRSGASIPRLGHRQKLLQILYQAKCHNWDSNSFVPICAFAESYPPSLHIEAREALNEVLNSASPAAAKERDLDDASIHLHICPANLSSSNAYAFANDPVAPTVFVVLVRNDLSFTERQRIGWEEVYAHVAYFKYGGVAEGGGTQSRKRSGPPLPTSPSVLRHHRPASRNTYIERGEDDD